MRAFFEPHLGIGSLHQAGLRYTGQQSMAANLANSDGVMGRGFEGTSIKCMVGHVNHKCYYCSENNGFYTVNSTQHLRLL